MLTSSEFEELVIAKPRGKYLQLYGLSLAQQYELATSVVSEYVSHHVVGDKISLDIVGLPALPSEDVLELYQSMQSYTYESLLEILVGRHNPNYHGHYMIDLQPRFIFITQADDRREEVTRVLMALKDEIDMRLTDVILLSSSDVIPEFLVDKTVSKQVGQFSEVNIIRPREEGQSLKQLISSASQCYRRGLDKTTHVLLIVADNGQVSKIYNRLRDLKIHAVPVYDNDVSITNKLRGRRKIVVATDNILNIPLINIAAIYDHSLTTVNKTSDEGYTTAFYTRIDRREHMRRSCCAEQRYIVSKANQFYFVERVLPEVFMLYPDMLMLRYLWKHLSLLREYTPHQLGELALQSDLLNVNDVDWRPRRVGCLLQKHNISSDASLGVTVKSSVLLAYLQVRPQGELIELLRQKDSEGRLLNREVPKYISKFNDVLRFNRRKTPSNESILSIMQSVYEEEQGKLILGDNNFYYQM